MTPNKLRVNPYAFRDLQTLDFEGIKRLANYYLIEGDLKGLLNLSNYSQIVVADCISEGGLPEKAIASIERDPEAAVRLYRQVRWKLNERSRELFRKLIAKVVVKISAGDSSGLSVDSFEYAQTYSPGMEFDLERTLQRIIESCKSVDEVRYDDIVARIKSKRNKSLIVILDASGSMTGKKILTAMMIAAITSHKLRSGKYGIVGFNSEAFVIKSPHENRDSGRVIEEILDLVPLGYTNISDGLRKGLEVSRGLRDPEFLLITDGEYNSGEDPRGVAKILKNLNVIYTAGRSRRGAELCKSLARLGSGSYFAINDYREIPRVMRNIFR